MQKAAGKELLSVPFGGTAYVSASKRNKEIKGKIEGSSQNKDWEKSFYLSPSSHDFPEGELWKKYWREKSLELLFDGGSAQGYCVNSLHILHL